MVTNLSSSQLSPGNCYQKPYHTFEALQASLVRREAHDDYMIAGLKDLLAKLERHAARRRATHKQLESSSEDSSAPPPSTNVAVAAAAPPPKQVATLDDHCGHVPIPPAAAILPTVFADEESSLAPPLILVVAASQLQGKTKASPFTDPATAAILPAQHNKEDDRIAQFQLRAILRCC
ncbi:unnamed protein product [Linum trigynum]|uniref:Uncharacterized protein n=1 Tax=Linum trigynum TaxID=586398 RepID=A0AAV2GQU9_9ROSI